MVEEVGDKRLYIKRERERKRAWVRVDAVLFKWPYLGTGTAQIRLRISAIWPDSSFFAYHLRWVYIHKTHTGLQKIQKQNTLQLHVAGHYSAEMSLHKAIPFSIQHSYCLKCIKHTISRTRLNLSLFQNLWFHSLMNVLFSSYHVTAIPSLNHSLLDVWLKSYHLKVCRIEINSKSNVQFVLRISEFGIQNSEFRIRNCEVVWKWKVSHLGHRRKEELLLLALRCSPVASRVCLMDTRKHRQNGRWGRRGIVQVRMTLVKLFELIQQCSYELEQSLSPPPPYSLLPIHFYCWALFLFFAQSWCIVSVDIVVYLGPSGTLLSSS